MKISSSKCYLQFSSWDISFSSDWRTWRSSWGGGKWLKSLTGKLKPCLQAGVGTRRGGFEDVGEGSTDDEDICFESPHITGERAIQLDRQKGPVTSGNLPNATRPFICTPHCWGGWGGWGVLFNQSQETNSGSRQTYFNTIIFTFPPFLRKSLRRYELNQQQVTKQQVSSAVMDVGKKGKEILFTVLYCFYVNIENWKFFNSWKKQRFAWVFRHWVMS